MLRQLAKAASVEAKLIELLTKRDWALVAIVVAVAVLAITWLAFAGSDPTS